MSEGLNTNTTSVTGAGLMTTGVVMLTACPTVIGTNLTAGIATGVVGGVLFAVGALFVIKGVVVQAVKKAVEAKP